MSEPENFIARWSRRKAEATEEQADPVAAPPDATAPGDQQEPAAPAAAKPVQASSQAPSQAAPPAIDPATLPPIESIVAGTDIKAFLQAGVPAELTRAALRRAWAADPSIRDFIGLSENSWDFTAPDGVPGFGPLSAEDASRLMADFSSTAKDVADKAKQAIERINPFEAPVEGGQTEPSPNESARPTPVSQHGEDQKTENPPQISSMHTPDADPGQLNSLQRNKDYIATQKDFAETDKDSRPVRRGHGGALPK